MRFEHLKEGERYVLVTDRSIQVTVLPTPEPLRLLRRVMVRFEVGVSRGRETDIPTRRIAAPVNRALAPVRPVARRTKRPDPPVLDRPARVNDQVTLAETAERLWRVNAVNEAEGTAMISTTIYDLPQSHTVALDGLQVRTSGPRRSGPASHEAPAAPPLVDPATERADEHRPIPPQRALDELMEDVYFSEPCLDDYQQRIGGGKRAGANERLREEVRRSGYVLDDVPAPPGEYARIRVNGRFDIVLYRKPSLEQPAVIERLRYPGRRRRQPRSAARRAA